VIFDLAGHATLAVLDSSERTRRAVRSLMDPYEPVAASGETADIVLEARQGPGRPLVDIHNPAGDAAVTASDGRDFYLVRAGLTCSLPAIWDGTPARLGYEPGFPIWSVFASVVRPAIHLALLERAGVAVHSASVAIDDRGIVVAGWSESGKTETALALLELGGRFVSDKWTILDAQQRIAPFPISVGVRRWVLPFLPTLRSSLPRRARAQLALAGLFDRASRPVRRRSPRPGARAFALAALERSVGLLDRAALTPRELAKAYGQPEPVRNVETAAFALLTPTARDDVKAAPADPTWVARRLVRSAAFERRGFFELYRRARYAFPERDGDLEREIERREERFLLEALSGTTLLDVRAPFPTDPRRVADAIVGRLG
jgi:hypothetical protein